jgi:hypothetical protein
MNKHIWVVPALAPLGPTAADAESGNQGSKSDSSMSMNASSSI